jgi:hypothetical protein
MKHSLQSLRVSALSNLEAGQLINRHLEDLGTIDPALLTDEPFNNYLLELTTYSDKYERALAQIQKNEETLAISLADKDRDRAHSSCTRCLSLYAISDDPEEVESSRILKIIFRNFKNLPSLNYEAETLAIDKLISDLEEPSAAQHVAKLNMGSYVNRLKNTNETFKALFSSRIQTEALTESYDMKAIRKETFATYRDFCNYVLAMAKAHDTPLFKQALDLINAGRKYYSDRMTS